MYCRNRLGDNNVPDETRFTTMVLAKNLDEPMTFVVLYDERVLIAERKGNLKLYDPKLDSTILIAHIPVNTKYTSKDGTVSEAEEGFIGLTADPDFKNNGWIYTYSSHPTIKKNQLIRWKFDGGKLIDSSKKIILEIGTQREVCCHTGGGMVWNNEGDLFLTVGNNTGNSLSAQTDERPGRESWDDQGHAANTNDLRGKILRIHPEKDGTYSIPKGNLFPVGTTGTRPEIYTMGNRNPWRISFDNKTGFLYWGEIGPDATKDSEIGPMGYDELNRAKGPGNFGWPYFIGPNRAYPYFDFINNRPTTPKDPKKILNLSINNTGLKELPPAIPALIYYPYGPSKEFPLVGSGSRSVIGGPLFHQSDFKKNAKRLFPKYYEGKWLVADLARGWIMSISIDRNGNYDSMERFLPEYHPVEPIDMKFGTEGDLYVLEYGSNWFMKSNNSQLVKIEYNGGNRAPIAKISVDKTGGRTPFEAQFSSIGSTDLDGDKLSYDWSFTDQSDKVVYSSNVANPKVKFDNPGVYKATLKISDPGRKSDSKSLSIIVGNAIPEAVIKFSGNQSFFFPGLSFNYDVDITDIEDGTISNGGIMPTNVKVSIDYVPDGIDSSDAVQMIDTSSISISRLIGQTIMAKNSCMNCHSVDRTVFGPSLRDISLRYQNRQGELSRLATKILQGGTGVWGTRVMPANPGVSQNDAMAILRYIMTLNDTTSDRWALKGIYIPKIPEGDDGRGYLLISAKYVDRGNGPIPSQKVQRVIRLRNSLIEVGKADTISSKTVKVNNRTAKIVLDARNHDFVKFSSIDLSKIVGIRVFANSPSRGYVGGEIKILIDSLNGKEISSVRVVPEQDRQLSQKEMMNAQKNLEEIPIVLINEVQGIHNIYLVFLSNNQSDEGNALMIFSGIEFIPKEKE